jgi:hypothetical protein
MTVRPSISVSALLCVGISLTGCDKAPTYTLYRSSSQGIAAGVSIRNHVATFDAGEADRNYNRSNCEMSARLRNANIRALNPYKVEQGLPLVGFWCEAGSYEPEGDVPMDYQAAFPTDTK